MKYDTGTILICVDEKDYHNITLGNKYVVVRWQSSDGHVSLYIYDDRDNLRGIEEGCFMTLDEYRDSKLNELGL